MRPLSPHQQSRSDDLREALRVGVIDRLEALRRRHQIGPSLAEVQGATAAYPSGQRAR